MLLHDDTRRMRPNGRYSREITVGAFWPANIPLALPRTGAAVCSPLSSLAR